MTDVGELLDPCHFSDFIDLSWEVVFSILDETVGEKVLEVLVRVHLGALPGPLVTSVVSEPHIVSSSGEDEGWSLISCVLDPSVAR